MGYRTFFSIFICDFGNHKFDSYVLVATKHSFVNETSITLVDHKGHHARDVLRNIYFNHTELTFVMSVNNCGRHCINIFLVLEADSGNVKEVIVVFHGYPESSIVSINKVYLSFGFHCPQRGLVTPVPGPFFLSPRVSNFN